jgi:polysaccharide pyruvyl transferase WcaK-like protein
MNNQQYVKIIVTQSVTEFKSLLNQMQIVVSSKMHPAILAVSSFVPVLSIVYDHKQTGFFQRLDMADCTLDISDVSYERLLSKIDQTWMQQAKLKEVLATQIPRWQRNVKSVMKKTVSLYVN